MRFARLDHIVLQVPDIAAAHARLLALGFEEAWPIGRTWPHGPTSGIALGGINLELLQPDEDPPETLTLAELVFERDGSTPLELYGRAVEKIEGDPAKLAARGFPAALRSEPQRICTNAFPGPESLWPHFVCEYAPILAPRLSEGRFAAPYGPIKRVEVGPLRARPWFVEVPDTPDLHRFIAETIVTTGARIVAGEDAVVWEAGARLNLRTLTVGTLPRGAAYLSEADDANDLP